MAGKGSIGAIYNTARSVLGIYGAGRLFGTYGAVGRAKAIKGMMMDEGLRSAGRSLRAGARAWWGGAIGEGAGSTVYSRTAMYARRGATGVAGAGVMGVGMSRRRRRY